MTEFKNGRFTVIDKESGYIGAKNLSAEAVMIPHFQEGASFGGVAGILYNLGARDGLDDFHNFVQETGTLSPGLVVLTKSKGPYPYLFNCVTVLDDPDPQSQFEAIYTATQIAGALAKNIGIKSIITPAFGTGIIGRLNPRQSAEAVLKGFSDALEGTDIKVIVSTLQESLFVEYGLSVVNETYKEAITPDILDPNYAQYIDTCTEFAMSYLNNQKAIPRETPVPPENPIPDGMKH